MAVCLLSVVILRSRSPTAESKPLAGKKQLGLLGQCIRIILNKTSPDILPASYEAIYNACQSVVLISDLGHDLYDTLKLELEKSIGSLANDLLASAENDTSWIISLNEAFKWFENQIVCSISFILHRLISFHSRPFLNLSSHIWIKVTSFMRKMP